MKNNHDLKVNIAVLLGFLMKEKENIDIFDLLNISGITSEEYKNMKKLEEYKLLKKQNILTEKHEKDMNKYFNIKV